MGVDGVAVGSSIECGSRRIGYEVVLLCVLADYGGDFILGRFSIFSELYSLYGFLVGSASNARVRVSCF